MGLLDGAPPRVHTGERSTETLEQTTRMLESVLLKQLLMSAGTFKGSGSAGSSIHAEMFAEAIADAVAQSGGLGLAQTLQAQLAPETAGAPAPSSTPALLDMRAWAPSAAGGPPPSSSLDASALLSEPAVLTSGFGPRRDPFTAHAATHRGVDLAAPSGTEVLAAEDGVVVRAGERGGYGYAVEIDHGDGLTTLYAHASELKVRPGDRVRRGQPIAAVGESGRATGPHLHFEARIHGKPVDPRRALKIYAERADAPDESRSQPITGVW